MKTCETCEHWSKMFERCKRDHGKTHIDCCDKTFGCIHHEGKKEPGVTVDEAINWCKDWIKWNVRSETQASKCVGLAIRALEEMKEREQDLDSFVKDFNSMLEQAEKEVTDITIDKAIKHINRNKQSGYEIPDKYCDLAIKALEEMRDREQTTPFFVFGGQPSSPQESDFEKAWKAATEASKKSAYPHPNDPKVMEYLKNLQNQKPRTWRDVTAGETYAKIRDLFGDDKAAFVKSVAQGIISSENIKGGDAK